MIPLQVSGRTPSLVFVHAVAACAEMVLAAWTTPIASQRQKCISASGAT